VSALERAWGQGQAWVSALAPVQVLGSVRERVPEPEPVWERKLTGSGISTKQDLGRHRKMILVVYLSFLTLQVFNLGIPFLSRFIPTLCNHLLAQDWECFILYRIHSIVNGLLFCQSK
jgi:hypothetical protein